MPILFCRSDSQSTSFNSVFAIPYPNDPEHAHVVEWIGVDAWDPAAFDSTEANDHLSQIKL